jgi:pimeloyl-ACP methyl ester carboxylesterase
MVDYPFTPHYLNLDGPRLHYVDEGHGDPIVLVHGNPTWSYHYRHLIHALATDYRVLAPDHIGCGRSDKPADADYAYTLDRRVADLGRFLDHVEPSRPVTLLLHDWGGMIGLAWACRQPQRVGRLILGNTAAFPLPAGKPLPLGLRLARMPLIGPLMVRGLNGFCRAALRWCFTSRKLTADEQAAYLAPYDSWARRRAVLRFVQDIPLRPGDPAWQTVQATAERLEQFRRHPILILWGRRDFVFDDSFLAEWRQRWPDAEIKVFESAGHFVFEDAREEAIELIRDFLKRRPPLS